MEFIRVPSLAENVTEATVQEWLVQEGAVLEPGTPVAELVTEKASFTLEAEVGGLLYHRLAAEKSTLPVGYVMAVLAADPQEQPDLEQARDANARLLQQRGQRPTMRLVRGAALTPRPAGPQVRATPAARRVARELGVDLAVVAEALQEDRPVREDDVRAHDERSD